MKILITILIVIVGIIALLLIIALFIRKEYKVQSEIIINQPVQTVFDYLKQLKNQDNFNKWVMVDPNMKKTFTGTDGTVGFIYGWNGNKQAGEGEQEIKSLVEGKKLETETDLSDHFPQSITQTLQQNQYLPTKQRWAGAMPAK